MFGSETVPHQCAYFSPTQYQLSLTVGVYVLFIGYLVHFWPPLSLIYLFVVLMLPSPYWFDLSYSIRSKLYTAYNYYWHYQNWQEIRQKVIDQTNAKDLVEIKLKKKLVQHDVHCCHILTYRICFPFQHYYITFAIDRIVFE